MKKGRLIEEALLHRLQALCELPADILIPPRLLVTPESFAKVAELAGHVAVGIDSDTDFDPDPARLRGRKQERE